MALTLCDLPGRAVRSAPTPKAWTAPCRRVARGGSWNNTPENARSASRNRNTPDNRNNNIGFRVGSTLSARAGATKVSPGEHLSV
ncbi:MAG: SUMF1/EgtB/PvdO family nonheme iron enzyme, partial [Rhodomicrobium sp.]